MGLNGGRRGHKTAFSPTNMTLYLSLKSFPKPKNNNHHVQILFATD